MAKKPTLRHVSDGRVFTRTTDRTYTHVVTVRGYTSAFVEKYVQSQRKRAGENWDWHLECSQRAIGDKQHPDSTYLDHLLVDEAFLQRHRYELARMGTREQHQDAVEAAIREAYPLFEHAQRAILGWCGRPDLADKLAMSGRTTSVHAGIRVEAINGGAA